MINLRARLPCTRVGEVHGKIWALVCTLAFALVLSSTIGCAAESTTAAQNPAPPIPAKNVILFIGDGVDDHQLTLARNYLFGRDGEFTFDRFPHRAAVRVETVLEEDPEMPEYVADSANSATAIATGTVTSRGRIATTAGSDEDLVTLIELAQRSGRGTGLVTTASITDATPASFVAHARIRYCEGPNEMPGSRGGMLPGCPDDLVSRGGPGSISEQLARSGVDVLLGGGLDYFEQTNEAGESVLELAVESGYRIARDAAELAALGASPTSKTLGLFGGDTLPVEWVGEDGRIATPLRFDTQGKPIEPSPFGCVDNPSFGSRPTLAAMTRKALELLEPSRDGFFLMVESASIDKQAHSASPCGQIGEFRALDRSVAAALEFQQRNPETLVIVTSDHGHAGQIVPWPSLFIAYQAVTGQAQHPSGKVARLRTFEGGTMTVHYGTNKLFLEEHTGTQVPAFAQGPSAESVNGLIRQVDLFAILSNAMGL